MMRVLFFNIAYMDYYIGSRENIDEPRHGGRYVDINGEAHEDMNFYPHLDDEWCLGFFETKRTNKETSNQLRIERLPDVQATDDDVDNVFGHLVCKA